MIDALSLTESRQAEQGFYPTPARVADKMLEGIIWPEVQDVLEPSAGKGDLADAVERQMTGRLRHNCDGNKDKIDCIELDENLRHILKGKGYRVVHDDFLTYETHKRYDLIVMNPPFFEGDRHLLKALQMIRHGGQVVCLLNAETIENPYTFTRKELIKALESADEHSVTDLGNAFEQAERGAQARVYMVKARYNVQADESDLMADLRKASPIREVERDESGQIIKGDWREAIVDHYNYEVACGIKLISEWHGMLNLLQSSLKKESYSKPILQLTMGDSRNSSATVNPFIGQVRYKYWEALFSQPEFVKQLTSNLQTDLYNRLGELRNYEFSVYNIVALQHELSKQVIGGIEKTIMDLFDDWTRKYHWDENSVNRHYFNGWRTNDAFAVNKKVIIPMYGLEDRWMTRKGGYRLKYETARKLSDIEKVFDYLDGGLTQSLRHAGQVVEEAVNDGQTRNIACKYFEVTLYKKGTCHIKFTDMDVIQKFNLFAARGKNWLPPSYGKKAYKEMDAEEKAVIDSFEGEESYNRVMARPDYFLTEASDMLRLEGAS
ncbi:MAG: DUF4942 domain-containing protein [Christensenellales bacterium]|jgi:hypothetical protein